MPPLTDKHSFKLCCAVKGCIPLGDHHRRQPWLRGYPTSETCCICALYGAVIRVLLEERFGVTFSKPWGPW